MDDIEIQSRLKRLGRKSPNKYLSGVFRTHQSYITLAIQGKRYPKLKNKIEKHIYLLERKNE